MRAAARQHHYRGTIIRSWTRHAGPFERDARLVGCDSPTTTPAPAIAWCSFTATRSIGLDLPALVVGGSADPWSNSAVIAEIAASLRRPEVLMIDGVGHLPNLEAEHEFNDALRAFLARHAPA
jgi:pimeloyl-ACP methyl ester carboxylesterase